MLPLGLQILGFILWQCVGGELYMPAGTRKSATSYKSIHVNVSLSSYLYNCLLPDQYYDTIHVCRYVCIQGRIQGTVHVHYHSICSQLVHNLTLSKPAQASSPTHDIMHTQSTCLYVYKQQLINMIARTYICTRYTAISAWVSFQRVFINRE